MKTNAALIVITLLTALTPVVRSEDPASLSSQLSAAQKQNAAKTPDSTKRAFAAGIKSVADSGILEKALVEGNKAPDFTLKNHAGEDRLLSNYLQEGPVVLTWYRGGWCPYCNLQLAAYQKALPDINAAGGTLLALTPELPDKSLSTKQKHALEFEVLTDLNHKVAREYGLVFKLTPEVAELYKGFFDLKEFNGADAAYDELPLAATYVIDTEGTIRWSFLDADYRKRAEPSEVVEALNKLKR